MKQVLILFATFVLFAVAEVPPPDNELPDYHHLPVYIIDLSEEPEMRFAQVTYDLKAETKAVMHDYLKLAPAFMEDFFKEHEHLIKLRHYEYYREVEGIAKILDEDIHLVLMLQYAQELEYALCTSIVARKPNGHVIHGRNLDFAFADAVRNATYIAKFYRRGEYLYDANMFGGYVGVLTAFKRNAYSLSLNSRGYVKGGAMKNYEMVVREIQLGVPEIGMATRDALNGADTFDQAVDAMSSFKTICPKYVIMAGMGPNDGVVISRDPDGVANIRQLDDDHWYVAQTNDDHFAGVCQQRCVDANNHMQSIGAADIDENNLLEQVMLQSHTFNYYTIYTNIMSPADDYFASYGFDTDMPYVRYGPTPTDLPFDTDRYQQIPQ